MVNDIWVVDYVVHNPKVQEKFKMVNGRSSLEKISAKLNEEKSALEQKADTLRELERTDEIDLQLKRIEEQLQIIYQVIQMIDDMADGFGSLDLFLERIKQFSPVMISLADSYGKEITPILGNALTAIQKIEQNTLAESTDLYKARAKHIKIYYDALTGAGLPPEVAAKVVAHQGAPYSLMTMLEKIFQQVHFNVKID